LPAQQEHVRHRSASRRDADSGEKAAAAAAVLPGGNARGLGREVSWHAEKEREPSGLP